MASEGISVNSTNAEFGGGGDTETVVGVNRKVRLVQYREAGRRGCNERWGVDSRWYGTQCVNITVGGENGALMYSFMHDGRVWRE